MTSISLPVLKHKLAEQALHIDFLRLRCGSEEHFATGIARVRHKHAQLPVHPTEDIHPLISFSEWDAVLVVPSSKLYPRILTDIYADVDVAASVSGTSGYFAYLWEHPVNEHWRETLTHVDGPHPTILMSLRFADWFRQDVGLGTEILFCNRLEDLLIEKKGVRDVRLMVAHSLGWNDVILLMTCDEKEERLTELLTLIRLTTLSQCIARTPREKSGFSQRGDAQIFAASYSHLLGGFESFTKGQLSFGSLAKRIDSARLLVRVAPPHEQRVREFMEKHKHTANSPTIDSEMGHYSLSIDISRIAKRFQGKKAIQFIADTRRHIGKLSRRPDSYAETTSIFRFLDPVGEHQSLHYPSSPELDDDIREIEGLLQKLPNLLEKRGASSMTSHRFVSVLNTILDHLFDPVRSSVVRHLSRFAATIPERIHELNLDGIDDLCHVLEYAVGQAIDGIAQFQHDANALGLSGRGGYSRLITAVEWYTRSTVVSLGMKTQLPLITFGLRSGNAGSTGRYQIDIPFNVLFVPSRWHIILHEIGHLAWLDLFGWMMESLAMYRVMEREVRIEIQRTIQLHTRAATRFDIDRLCSEQVQVEFLRTREIVRELFPSYLMFALPCGGQIDTFDALLLRPMLTSSQQSSLSRDLLVRAVTHCALGIMQEALNADAARSRRKRRNTDTQRSHERAMSRRAARWWGIWEGMRSESQSDRIDEAIVSISDTLLSIVAETRADEEALATPREKEARRPTRLEPNLAAAMLILHSIGFRAAVDEALHSVIMVLSLRARQFSKRNPVQLAAPLFGTLLERIERARTTQSDPVYQQWLGKRFAEWLHAGEVLTRHRESFAWSRLLVGSRAELLAGDHVAFMRSQLSALLSMWHDAITENRTQETKRASQSGVFKEPYEELEGLLGRLGVVRNLEATVG